MLYKTFLNETKESVELKIRNDIESFILPNNPGIFHQLNLLK